MSFRDQKLFSSHLLSKGFLIVLYRLENVLKISFQKIFFRQMIFYRLENF